ncbi:MAG: hypothetical protein RIS48_1936 [Pseudomonadota bacterium]|jgi:copper(I)-binding protein
MNKILLAACLVTGFSSTLWAQTAVKIEDAWVRGTVAQQKATGAFMKLTAESDVKLVGAQFDGAGVAEVHEMTMENNVMKMRAVPALALPAGKAVELKPGGYHVMLMDLKQQLKAGEQAKIMLTFEDAKQQRFTQQIEVPIKAMAPAMMPHQNQHRGQHQ